MEKLILGIETSCDECSASVLRSTMGANVLQHQWSPISVSTYSQILLHEPYGGVVPEVASRNHLEQIQPVIRQALLDAQVQVNDLDAIAVTNRPGLIGALLVGLTAAKALGYVHKKPLIPVHHLEGHLMSPFLSTAENESPLAGIQFPVILLMVSGGHTQLHFVENPPTLWSKLLLKESLLGSSIDDAAGEAFDKTAKILGYPYPGGKYLDSGSRGGNREAYAFPRGLKSGAKKISHHETNEGYDFSFSGLKTAVMLKVKALESESTVLSDGVRADLCASIQESIVESLLLRTLAATKNKSAKSVIVVGGVAANSRLRERLQTDLPVPVFYPDLKYCTDNAAMIAAAGAVRFHQGQFLSVSDYLTLNAFPSAEF